MKGIRKTILGSLSSPKYFAPNSKGFFLKKRLSPLAPLVQRFSLLRGVLLVISNYCKQLASQNATPPLGIEPRSTEYAKRIFGLYSRTFFKNFSCLRRLSAPQAKNFIEILKFFCQKTSNFSRAPSARVYHRYISYIRMI